MKKDKKGQGKKSFRDDKESLKQVLKKQKENKMASLEFRLRGQLRVRRILAKFFPFKGILIVMCCLLKLQSGRKNAALQSLGKKSFPTSTFQV